MDREIRTVIECLQKWAARKNRFKSFDYTFDYKLNAHPTTENSPMLSELMRIQASSMKISLLNAKNNEMMKSEINQMLTPFRELK
jgi:hypothetical protein